jgi:hypothetical protein
MYHRTHRTHRAVIGASPRRLIERPHLLSHNTTVALASTWILAAGFVGVIGNVTSLAAGVLVVGCGLVPPLLMMHLTGQRRSAD